jgi:hypothetical protein
MDEVTSSDELVRLLHDIKQLARRYYEITKRPLGITGEIAEYEATRILGLELSPVRQAGYDAVRKTESGVQRLQIKGRLLGSSAKLGQRLGALDLRKEWDAVVLVILDECFEPTALYEADRSAICDALTVPGSRARNERGQLSVGKFKSIGRQVWPN